MIKVEECAVNCNKFDIEIEKLLSKYSKNQKPIEVSFRKLVPELNKSDRFTHLIHTYPAKLLPHIPHFFINNNILSRPGDTILDSFSGSGTVMLEAILANRNAIGADANPLARLISSVKVHNYSVQQLIKTRKNIFDKPFGIKDEIIPKVANVDFWFLPTVQKQLIAIFNVINGISDKRTRDFFLVCFSNCIKKVSLADPRVSVPVKLNPNRYKESHPLFLESKRKLDNLNDINVLDKLLEIVDYNIERFKGLNEKINGEYSARIVSVDARRLTEKIGSKNLIPDSSIDLILSSPPYAGAQKYIRASSLNLGWLNFIESPSTLRDLDGLNIGRENYKKSDYIKFKSTGIEKADRLLRKVFKINPLRAFIAANYLIEMKLAFEEAVRVLKPGGHFVLVVGNNQVCGLEFETQDYLKQILENLGLITVLRLIDDIQSYGLMTKRNKTANVITREWVLIFKKPKC